MRTIDQMVQQEILCCMSSVVNALAQGYGLIQSASAQSRNAARDLDDLTEQAFELACPIPDYEEAAIQSAWAKNDAGQWSHGIDPDDGVEVVADSAEEACELSGIEPYAREVFEHWAVTDWFADKLVEQGEKVDKDFGNLCIWARTTTGQSIAADGVIERIYTETHTGLEG